MNEKELAINESKIQLKECGSLLRLIAWESLVSENEMYFCEVEDFEDLLEDGNIFFQQTFQQTRKNGTIRCNTK